MSAPKATDQAIIAAYAEMPRPAALAVKFRISERQLRMRLNGLRARGFCAFSPDKRSPFYKQGSWKEVKTVVVNYDARVNVDLEGGLIIVGSDAHYWPGEISTAHRGFLHFIKELRPRIVILNGDVFDGARISRFARIGWDKTPTVIDELKAVKERLGEIEAVAGSALKFWPLGNHDARFENKLAQQAPEYEGVQGFHLKDHFPLWRPCWSVMVNSNLLITHRWKGGKYAAPNNALQAGVSMCTGHLHSLKWWPHTDETGTRYGVDSGTLAEPKGQQFINYLEDSTPDWRSGFAVLTIHRHALLQPELAKVHAEGEIDFRGTTVSV